MTNVWSYALRYYDLTMSMSLLTSGSWNIGSKLSRIHNLRLQGRVWIRMWLCLSWSIVWDFVTGQIQNVLREELGWFQHWRIAKDWSGGKWYHCKSQLVPERQDQEGSWPETIPDHLRQDSHHHPGGHVWESSLHSPVWSSLNKIISRFISYAAERVLSYTWTSSTSTWRGTLDMEGAGFTIDLGCTIRIMSLEIKNADYEAVYGR